MTENIDPLGDHDYTRKRHRDHTYVKTVSSTIQGSAFQSAINMFAQETKMAQQRSGEEIDDGVVFINDVKLNIIYNPSHLIKGLRNNFLNKDLKWGSRVAKWQDIVDVYKGDCNHTHIRLLHILNDQHVLLEKIKKMKVKNCVSFQQDDGCSFAVYNKIL